MRQLATELLASYADWTRRTATTNQDLTDTVTTSATSLTQLPSLGTTLMAAKILANTGPIRRFRSTAAFASFCGAAPIEVSCGPPPPSLAGGDRQLT